MTHIDSPRALNARLNEAADHLDYLYAGAKHIPTNLVHDREFRAGLICTATHEQDQWIGQFFWGGAAEVFMTLGPAVLPLLATVLRDAADDTHGHFPHVSVDGSHCCSAGSALALADHILTVKESLT